MKLFQKLLHQLLRIKVNSESVTVESRYPAVTVNSPSQPVGKTQRISLRVFTQFQKNHDKDEYESYLIVDSQPVAWMEYLCVLDHKFVVKTIILNHQHLDIGYIKVIRENTENFHGAVQRHIDLTIQNGNLEHVLFFVRAI